ncbi:MAG: VWA domain-containing protein [Thermoproteota archaeon]
MMDKEEARRVFAQVRGELYFPPCELEIKDNGKKGPPFFITGSKVHISLKAVPEGVDKERFLKSVIRHEVSHFHYCPYDIRTAYELVKEAYKQCYNWDIAYFSLLLFSDLNVDCFYLLNRFGEIPYHVNNLLETRQMGISKHIQAAYSHLLRKTHGKYGSNVESVARQISMVMRSERNWFSKIRLIAIILAKNNVKAKVPRHIAGYNAAIPLREDLGKNTVEKISEVLGGIKENKEARSFYEYWIKPRLGRSEIEELKKTVKRKGRRRAGKEKTGTGSPGKSKDSSQVEAGREPSLPTSVSKPYSRLSDKLLEETLWRVFWYRARAKRTMLIYLEEGKRPEPNLSISRYPTDWNIEDEVEDLDLESSLDEGKLRVEMNTVKWESEIKGKGSSLTIINVPSSLIVLDASRSMRNVFDDAATSAFINLLSVERIRGKTGSITFSTNYYSVDWQGSTLEKELALALYFGKMTILPMNEIMRLAAESENRVLINIITDCGWQNVEEVIPILEQIVKNGHRIKMFYLQGGKYPENIKKISRVGGIKIIPVKDPEKDLQYLVTRETSEDYGEAMLVFKDQYLKKSWGQGH